MTLASEGAVAQVRLRACDQEALIACFRDVFLPEDHLWLFGSRADMNKRGGDIDLYVETHHNDWDVLLPLKYRFLSMVKDKIGDQKIDLILRCVTDDSEDKPIYKEARATGVLLA